MIGLVLWFNPDAKTGMIWCEDQGPLAFVGPDVTLPEGRGLDCGDQLTFSIDLRDGVRFVRDIYAVAPGTPGQDPADIIRGFRIDEAEESRHLSVVA